MLVKYRYFKNMNLFTFCEIVLVPENLMVKLKSILAIILKSRIMIYMWMVTAAMKLKNACFLEEKLMQT